MIWRRLLIVLAWGAVLDAALSCALIFGAAWRYPVLPRPPGEPAAAILFWPSGGRFDDKADRLARAAITAWEAGTATRFVCVGGLRPARGFHGSRALCARLVEAGVPADRVVVGPGSNDTVSNLHEAQAVTAALGVQRLWLMTDSMHLLRIGWMLDGRSGDVSWQPYPVALSADAAATILRSQQEVAAYLTLILPDRLRVALLGWTRA